MHPLWRGFTLVEVMIVVAIIGLLAAVSFPALQDFVIRARVSEAVLVAGKVRTDLSAFYAEHGRFPATPEERRPFEITSTDGHPAIRRLALHGVGACNLNAGCRGTRIEIQLQRAVYFGVGGDANSQLRLEGVGGANGAVTSWRCGPRDVQPLKLQWLPASCRASTR
jgi:type IV pilus assembly protein PilA